MGWWKGASEDERAANNVGLGPYKLVEWRRGISVELEAYEDYKPVIKELQTINREMHAIRTDTDMTPDEKRKELDELYMEKLEVTKDIYPYRPGGPEDKGKSDPIISRESQQWLKDLIGKTKREQVDILIGAGLPHAATLINDVTIGPTKLKAAA